MTELQIVCLGEFQVTLAGTALTVFQTDKARALLAYLAIEGQAHQRSELAQWLWPGYSDERAPLPPPSALSIATTAPGG